MQYMTLMATTAVRQKFVAKVTEGYNVGQGFKVAKHTRKFSQGHSLCSICHYYISVKQRNALYRLDLCQRHRSGSRSPDHSDFILRAERDQLIMSFNLI